MTGEPSRHDKAGVHEGGRAARARSNLGHDGAAGPEPGNTSPLRWALVIVPLVLLVLGTAHLAGLWTSSLQQAREERRDRGERPAPAKVARPAPSTADRADARESGFDAGVVVGLLSKADPRQGASVFKMCAACHTDERNGPHRIGPNLWGIVGHTKAALPGFAYSQALRANGGTWSYRELAEYLHDPRTSVQGTSMAFVGIKDTERMANLIAYMRTRADKPAPLPD